MKEASQALIDFKTQNDLSNSNNLNSKLNEYISRAEQLKLNLFVKKPNPTQTIKFKTENQVALM